jgi:hypothetical protein
VRRRDGIDQVLRRPFPALSGPEPDDPRCSFCLENGLFSAS